ncbi:MAG: hypothetical protein K2K67_10400 [Treponemataceae bacterium]|nr:hypothetical protein [Treponemataceae bacterium]
MELTFVQLEKSANKSGLSAYFCNDTFKRILSDLQEENDGLAEIELKEEVMFRLLDENLNYGASSEQSWELDGAHDRKHSQLMETRAVICEQVAHAWVMGEIDTLISAQKLADKLVKKFSIKIT